MGGAGLAEIWTESGLVGENSASKVLQGKAYSKAMRLHKLTYQALRHILLLRLLQYISEQDELVAEQLSEVVK